MARLDYTKLHDHPFSAELETCYRLVFTLPELLDRQHSDILLLNCVVQALSGVFRDHPKRDALACRVHKSIKVALKETSGLTDVERYSRSLGFIFYTTKEGAIKIPRFNHEKPLWVGCAAPPTQPHDMEEV